MSKQRIVVEFEMPDNYDMCWDDNHGLQAFSEVFFNDNARTICDRTFDIAELEKKEPKQPHDIAFIAYLEVLNKMRWSLAICGVLDDNDKLINYKKGVGLEGVDY